MLCARLHIVRHGHRPSYRSNDAKERGPRDSQSLGPIFGDVMQHRARRNSAQYRDPEILIDDLPLDRGLTLTRFPDQWAKTKAEKVTSLRNLADAIRRKAAPGKADLPLIKLASFGDVPTVKGSLRHNSNMLSVSGVEADYDAGIVSLGEAAKRLKVAGVAGLIYSSPSHTPEAPRWRVLAPLSHDHAPEDREELCARLNGALGGILASESFVLSQSYYAGGVVGKAPVETLLMDGNYLDRVQGVPQLGKNGAPYAPRIAADPYSLDDLLAPAPKPVDWPEVRKALYCIPPEVTRDDWRKAGGALHHASEASAEGFTLWQEWSETADYCDAPDRRPFDLRIAQKEWEGFGKSRRFNVGSLFHLARQHGYESPRLEVSADDFDDLAPPTSAAPSRLTFLSPSDCERAPSRGYLVKGLFAPGDVGCIFGAPGAGKSLLAPFLGYAVAQGTDAFGMRTRPGKVFYVAAEDPTGMRGRVQALKAAHGDADRFRLVEGVSDLLASGSPDLAALVEAVKAEKPALIFIDTLAMAFPGLEENDAKAMGRIVAVARKLARGGAAVILIHHDTKAEGSTPRGHSLLNGALDVALHVKRDEGGIIRGKLTKNRNGTCDRDMAFTIVTEEGGTDEDGDLITLPRCRVVSGGQRQRLNMPTGQAAAALEVLERLQAAANGQKVSKADWRKECAASDAVCSKDDPDTRKKAFYRAVEMLTRGCHVESEDGFCWIDSGFDDLPSRDGQGHGGDMSPDVTRDNDRSVRDGQGHTP